jgi:hypothetical protein
MRMCSQSGCQIIVAYSSYAYSERPSPQNGWQIIVQGTEAGDAMVHDLQVGGDVAPLFRYCIYIPPRASLCFLRHGARRAVCPYYGLHALRV